MFLVAGVAGIGVAKALRLRSIVGCCVAGALVGPHGFAVLSESDEVQLLAELQRTSVGETVVERDDALADAAIEAARGVVPTPRRDTVSFETVAGRERCVPTVADKKADLAGPGISTYEEVARVLPTDYASLLTPMETMRGVFEIKRTIEDGLCRELNLNMVQVPLIVDRESGMNDMLDRDGSRTPVEFPCGLGLDQPIRGQVVQAATKWKRLALKHFGCKPGEGICTDMKAVRKDYFLDHDHSSYVDQWDWEKAVTADQRHLDYLTRTVQGIWKVIRDAGLLAQEMFPALRDSKYPPIPEELTFIHAEDLLDKYPDLPRKQRETKILQEHPAVFIYGIGYPLDDGYPHEMRAADYDDWITEVTSKSGRKVRGLNGDILVWNPVTKRRHELTSMGVRVTKDTLVQQMKMAGLEKDLELPYHRMILNDQVPLSIGGGIGQSRTYMYLLRKAHLGEVSVTVWPKALKAICEERNIHVLQ